MISMAKELDIGKGGVVNPRSRIGPPHPMEQWRSWRQKTCVLVLA